MRKEVAIAIGTGIAVGGGLYALWRWIMDYMLIQKAAEEFQRLGGVAPLEGFPEKWRITSGFGWRRHPITKELKFHSGVDMIHMDGTYMRRVYAPIPGTAYTWWDDDYGGGRSIAVVGGNLRFGFAHLLDNYFIENGTPVDAGTEIAFADSSGWASTGNHVHLTVAYKVKGRWIKIDPARFFKALGWELKRK